MKASRVLRSARRRRGLTQRQLAASAGVPQPVVARIETGRVVPRVDTLHRLLTACGESLEALPRAGDGVDRSLLGEMLALSPRGRIGAVASAGRSLAPVRGRAPAR